MINLQDTVLPTKASLFGVEKHIEYMRDKFSALTWLSHRYGIAYKVLNIDRNQHSKYPQTDKFTNTDRNIKGYYPKVYQGFIKGVPQLFDVRPDNDKKGQIFFIVGNEKKYDNNYVCDVSIVFSVNLQLIDSALLKTDIFTEQLIEDVKKFLQPKYFKGVKIEIEDIKRKFSDVFLEYTLKESNMYAFIPMQSFRFNTSFTYKIEC